MSWAEVQMIKNGQEPMYYNGKKVNNLYVHQPPRITQSIKFLTEKYYSSIGNIHYTQDGTKAFVHHYKIDYGSGSIYSKSYRITEYDFLNKTETLLGSAYYELLNNSTPYTAYVKDQNGNVFKYLHDVTVDIKLNNYYIFLPLYQNTGTGPAATVGGPRPKIGVSTEITFDKSTSPTPSDIVFTDMPVDSPTSTTQYYTLFTTVDRIDIDNNAFWFFITTRKNSTNYLQYYYAEVSNDMTVQTTLLDETPIESKKVSNYYYANAKSWELSATEFLFGNHMYNRQTEGMVSRELNNDEKDIFSFLPVGSGSNMMYNLYKKDNILYYVYNYSSSSSGYGHTFTTRLYRNTYYIDGDKEWHYIAYDSHDSFSNIQLNGLYPKGVPQGYQSNMYESYNHVSSNSVVFSSDGACKVIQDINTYKTDISKSIVNNLNDLEFIFETE